MLAVRSATASTVVSMAVRASAVATMAELAARDDSGAGGLRGRWRDVVDSGVGQR